MMAIDAKSKWAANLLRFRFIGVFMLFFFPVLFVVTTHSRKFETKFLKKLKQPRVTPDNTDGLQKIGAYETDEQRE